jgi:hypothetical protein
MSRLPSPDACYVALKAAGWSVGETAVRTATGLAWCVDGRNGENVLLARAATQAAAWRRAVEQARSLGMLGLAGRALGG